MAGGHVPSSLASASAGQAALLWGSLVSCGRLSNRPTAAIAADSGGRRGTLWVARRLPAGCQPAPHHASDSTLMSCTQVGGVSGTEVDPAVPVRAGPGGRPVRERSPCGPNRRSTLRRTMTIYREGMVALVAATLLAVAAPAQNPTELEKNKGVGDSPDRKST